jgi:hypothetical protein
MRHSQGLGCAKVEKFITNEHSTLQQHIAVLHSVCPVLLDITDTLLI